MRSDFELPSSYRYQASLRSRATTYALTLLATILIILMLFELGVIPPIVPEQALQSITVQMMPEAKIAPKPAKAAGKVKHDTGGSTKRTPTPKKAPPAASQKAPPHVPVPWNVMPLSAQDFAQSDIANKPHSDSTQTADSGQGTGQGEDSGAGNGGGDGPGGAQLYNAEWYKRPTDAEMAFYMPHNNQPGWAEIACKTLPQYRVDSCIPLGESPGSGLSRAVLQAAWQFRILPPRINGRPLIGAWVRIHYTFSVRDGGAKDGDAQP